MGDVGGFLVDFCGLDGIGLKLEYQEPSHWEMLWRMFHQVEMNH